MFKECLGKEFDEVVEIVKKVAEKDNNSYFYVKKNKNKLQYSFLIYSTSPYGFFDITYDFVFNEKGICIDIDIDGIEEE